VPILHLWCQQGDTQDMTLTPPNPVTWRSMCMWRKLTWTLTPPPQPGQKCVFSKTFTTTGAVSPSLAQTCMYICILLSRSTSRWRYIEGRIEDSLPSWRLQVPQGAVPKDLIMGMQYSLPWLSGKIYSERWIEEPNLIFFEAPVLKTPQSPISWTRACPSH
jgi:hypothetical protein